MMRKLSIAILLMMTVSGANAWEELNGDLLQVSNEPETAAIFVASKGDESGGASVEIIYRSIDGSDTFTPGSVEVKLWVDEGDTWSKTKVVRYLDIDEGYPRAVSYLPIGVKLINEMKSGQTLYIKTKNSKGYNRVHYYKLKGFNKQFNKVEGWAKR